MSVHAILPAAGQAVRLRRLPKFLLPTTEDAKTLIERHIGMLESICDVIWLPVRPDLVPLVHDLNFGQRVIPVALSTSSMTETVLRITSISGANRFILGMPDTAFTGEMPYSFLFQDSSKSNLSLALWHTSEQQRGKVGAIDLLDGKVVDSVDKDVSSSYLFHWGAMAFDRKFVDLLRHEMPHTGYGIGHAITNELKIGAAVMAGKYFDCGTFSEYKRFLNEPES
jgi:hypothetical protein